ncbi:MAG: rubredoxin [Saprospiraceae bacterium]|nr:rubredoxin [Saprospiraceae bacterium]MBP7643138.1 rubredoxin [Saprospiraceae bacterium]
MKKNNDLYRMLIKGGVLSPNEMKQIVKMGKMLSLETIYFGSRQDILLPKVENIDIVIEKFPELDINFVADRKFQNVMSSYVSANIFPSTTWLKGATYLYILSNIKTKPKLKINIVDPKQKLVPLITGDLNFIASEIDDYWFLYLRFKNDPSLKRFPVLVFSWDIPKIIELIEIEIFEEGTESVDVLYTEIISKFENCRAILKDLTVPFIPFPNYEGINPEGLDSYWLGLYWRNNKYDLNFLDAISDFCLDWKIGRLCLTPWKSFIIKGIPKNAVFALEKLLGKFGINARHSSLELNWHLPVNVDDALDLKKFIVRTFDQNDISTNGLTFGISHGNDNVFFTAIVIKKYEALKALESIHIRPTYDILYSETFDPNKQDYKVYAQDVDKMELPSLLIELSKLYFDQLQSTGSSLDLAPVQESKNKLVHAIFQCPTCQCIYDPELGDETNSIPPKTKFTALPINYSCFICATPKDQFIEAEAHTIYN